MTIARRRLGQKTNATVVRIQPGNLDILERVDPECFDEPISAQRAALCVSSSDAVLVVAIAAGVVVGQCLGANHRHPDKATELYVDDLAVAPEWRRQGIAKRAVPRSLPSSAWKLP